MMEDERIDELINILETSTDEFTRWRAVARLGEIAKGDERAISELVRILETSTNEDTRRKAAYILGEIATGNERAISELVRILETSTNEDTRRKAAGSLVQIATGNERAISELVRILETSTNEDTRRKAAGILDKIATGGERAISELVRILETSTDEYTRRRAAKSLVKIGKGSKTAISALLVYLLENSTNENIRSQATCFLGEIGTGNKTAISALIKLLETTTNEDTRRQAAESLGKIATGNERAISALVRILETSTDEDTRRQAASSLGKIATGNERAISALVRILETSTNEDTRWEAAYSLGKIATGNERAISALVKLLETSTDEDVRVIAAENLNKIEPNNQTSILALIDLWENTRYEDIRTLAIKNLYEIVNSVAYYLPTNKQHRYTRVICIDGYEDQEITINPKIQNFLYENLYNYLGKSIVTFFSFIKKITKIYNAFKNYINSLIPAIKIVINKLYKLIKRKVHAYKYRFTKKLPYKSTNREMYFPDINNVIINGHVSCCNFATFEKAENIEDLLNLLFKRNNKLIQWKTTEAIIKFGLSESNASLTLVRFLNSTNNEFIQWQCLKSLKQIWQNNQISEQLSSEIRKYSQSTNNKFILWQISEYWQDINLASESNYQSDPNFYIHYNKIINCIDVMQEGRDLFSRRLLINSCLEVHHRIIQFCIQSANVHLTFFYTEIFRNRYLVERIAQQDAPLPQTISPALAQQIQTAKQTERQTLQKYTDAISNHRPETELETLSQAWEQAKQTLENLYHQVAEIEPEFIVKTKVYPIHFQEVQQLLPTDTAIIEFFFTETELITLLIFPGTQHPLIPETLRIKLKPNHLKTLADDWVADLKDKNKSKTDTIDTTIQQLPQRIAHLGKLLNFTDLNQYIPRQINHLIVLPNNYLHLFPIHALPWNESQRIIDRFSVRYFPNLHIWKICQKRQRTRDSFLGIENPTADENLIFAKAEIAGIRQTGNFKKTEVLPGDEAKKTKILQDAKNYHCFHFSGHAEYNFNNPLESYLELSASHSENLTLSTIFTDLHLPNADLATLSACCTGVVDAFQPTDEYLGIATGFLLAGAKAVVSSLWKVNSIATAFLLDEFYRQLDQTSDKAVALQNAQNWLRTCNIDELRQRANEWDLSKIEWEDRFALDASLQDLPGTPFKNPYYWAPFILTGC
jgi:CHAT domain-containing protein/HEAT repeat protein